MYNDRGTTFRSPITPEREDDPGQSSLRYTINKDNNEHYRVKFQGRFVATVHQHEGEVYINFSEAVPAHGLEEIQLACKFIFKGQRT